MPGWGVIPSIRVRDIAVALEYYRDRLGFEVTRGGADDEDVSLQRGDARVMLEVPTGFYGDRYNEAIRDRIGAGGPIALYIEAEDLEALHERLHAEGATVIDPLAERPWGQSEFTVEDPDGTWLTFWKASAG